MADVDWGLGLLHGLQSGFRSYWDQSAKRKDREEDMALKGFIKKDDKWVEDPAKLAKKRADELRKSTLELKVKGLDPIMDESGEIIDVKPSQYYGLINKKTKPDMDPYEIRKRELEIKKLEKELSGEKSKKEVPIVEQASARKLADAAATRESISYDIEQGLNQLKSDKLSDDEKVLVGRELLKTLNSLQGSDAVGAEEAKRLGGLLNWDVRLFEPGKMIGRDIDLFTKQVENNLARAKASAAQSKRAAQSAGGGLVTPAYDQDVLDYAQKYSISPEEALAIKNSRMGGQP